jgi:hypothetical protein
MRNPWPMAGILVLTGLIGALYVNFFANQGIWVLALVLITVIVLLFFGYSKYSNWLVNKLNSVVLEYQKNRDTDALQAEFSKWRFVATKYARDVMRINTTIALLEHDKFDDAKKEIDAVRLSCETTFDWMNYHLLLSDFAAKTGDKALARTEKRTADSIKKKIETTGTNPKERATKVQCKRAFINWVAFTALLLVGGGLITFAFKTTMLGSIGVAAFALSWFALPVTIGWGILWATR